MSSPLECEGSACNEHYDDSWKHPLLFTSGDVSGTGIDYMDAALTELDDSASCLMIDQPQPGWNSENVSHAQHLPYGPTLRSNTLLPGFNVPVWRGGLHASAASRSFASVQGAALGSSLSQEDYQRVPVGTSHQALDPCEFAETLSSATDYTSAMITSNPAVDDNGVTSSIAHESPFRLLYPSGASVPADASIERHHIFNIPSQAVESCQSPAREHSYHCGGHEEHLPYDYRSNTQQSHNLDPFSTLMERGDSHQSTRSINSRRSRRSLPSKRSSQTLACETCNIPFTGKHCKRNLTRHKQTIHGQSAIPLHECAVPGCNRAYKRSDALRVHEGKKHSTLFAPRQSRSKR